MKKTILLFAFLFSICVFSQSTDVEVYLETTEQISFEQYDLIKKVNEFHSDILISKQVKNAYHSNLKDKTLIESYLVYDMPTDCTDYSVLLYPDNTRLDYSYTLKKDGSVVYGNVTLFGKDVIRTVFVNSYGFGWLRKYMVNDKVVSISEVAKPEPPAPAVND